MGVVMATTAKQRADAVILGIRWARQQLQLRQRPGVKKKRSKRVTDLTGSVLSSLWPPTEAAFRRARLDFDKVADCRLLILVLAWAIYGPEPGHPKTWTERELRRLWNGFVAAKSADPKLKEGDYFKDLIKHSGKTNLYIGVTAATLRRRFQDAKKRFRQKDDI